MAVNAKRLGFNCSLSRLRALSKCSNKVNKAFLESVVKV